jgi:DNA invertase Pin-like site-specific DNA recombinase
MSASNGFDTSPRWPRFRGERTKAHPTEGADPLRHWRLAEDAETADAAPADVPPTWIAPVEQPGADLGERGSRTAIPAAPPANSGSDAEAASKLRALGYVSYDAPDEGVTPESGQQIETLDRYCASRGWELAEVVHDVRSPGRRDSAPGLDYALDRIAAGEASCLIVVELRRLGRSAAELGRIVDTIRERDVRLIALDTELDTKSRDGRVAVDALVAVGELERRRQVEITQQGLAAARAKGATSGRPTVHDVPALKRHIQAMRSSGMSLKAIADRLNDEGVPTLRGGHKWRPSSVQVAVGYRRPPRAPDPVRTYGNGAQWPPRERVDRERRG